MSLVCPFCDKNFNDRDELNAHFSIDQYHSDALEIERNLENDELLNQDFTAEELASVDRALGKFFIFCTMAM